MLTALKGSQFYFYLHIACASFRNGQPNLFNYQSSSGPAAHAVPSILNAPIVIPKPYISEAVGSRAEIKYY